MSVHIVDVRGGESRRFERSVTARAPCSRPPRAAGGEMRRRSLRSRELRVDARAARRATSSASSSTIPAPSESTKPHDRPRTGREARSGGSFSATALGDDRTREEHRKDRARHCRRRARRRALRLRSARTRDPQRPHPRARHEMRVGRAVKSERDRDLRRQASGILDRKHRVHPFQSLSKKTPASATMRPVPLTRAATKTPTRSLSTLDGVPASSHAIRAAATPKSRNGRTL